MGISKKSTKDAFLARNHHYFEELHDFNHLPNLHNSTFAASIELFCNSKALLIALFKYPYFYSASNPSFSATLGH